MRIDIDDADYVFEEGADAIDRLGKPQPTAIAQLCRQVQRAVCRRASCEEMVGDGAQGEDICLCARFTAAECLGSEIDFCRITEMFVDVARAGRDQKGRLTALSTGRNLPIHDLEAGLALGATLDLQTPRR